jgi:hypothetical protein
LLQRGIGLPRAEHATRHQFIANATFNGRCARHGSAKKAAGNDAASAAMLSSDFVVIFTAPWFASINCRCLIIASFGTVFFDICPHSISPN